MKLYEEGILQFEKTVGYYSNKFKNIADIRLTDIMNFNVSLITKERISELNTFEKNMDILYDIMEKGNQYPEYNDMGVMVLSLVIEEIIGKEFGTILDELIINPLNMKNTFWKVDSTNIENSFCYDKEYWYLNGILQEKRSYKGLPHDEKARVFAKEKRFAGHAGLFTTTEDMSTFAQAILNEKIITEKTLKMICNNENIQKKNAPQKFGFLTYTKNPIAVKSEVYDRLSDYSFAISGYTGTYFVIDPVKKIYVFIGADRINERIARTDIEEKQVIQIAGKSYIVSKDYVYMKDLLRDECCNRALEM